MQFITNLELNIFIPEGALMYLSQIYFKELLLQCLTDAQKLLGVEILDTNTPSTPVPTPEAEVAAAPPPSSVSLHPPSAEEVAPSPVPQVNQLSKCYGEIILLHVHV